MSLADGMAWEKEYGYKEKKQEIIKQITLEEVLNYTDRNEYYTEKGVEELKDFVRIVNKMYKLLGEVDFMKFEDRINCGMLGEFFAMREMFSKTSK